MTAVSRPPPGRHSARDLRIRRWRRAAAAPVQDPPTWALRVQLPQHRRDARLLRGGPGADHLRPVRHHAVAAAGRGAGVAVPERENAPALHAIRQRPSPAGTDQPTGLGLGGAGQRLGRSLHQPDHLASRQPGRGSSMATRGSPIRTSICSAPAVTCPDATGIRTCSTRRGTSTSFTTAWSRLAGMAWKKPRQMWSGVLTERPGLPQPAEATEVENALGTGIGIASVSARHGELAVLPGRRK